MTAMTAHTGRLYSRIQSDAGTFVNGRRQGWGYDAAGNVLQDRRAHTFDAAGRHTYAVATEQRDLAGDGTAQFPFVPNFDLTQTYDGDGQPAKRVQATRQNVYDDPDGDGVPELVQINGQGETTYYLRSSVLGDVIDELGVDGQGQLRAGRQSVYAAGQRVFREVYEQHKPAVGGWVQTVSDRLASREERDPMGAELPLGDPNPQQTYLSWKAPALLYIEGGDPFDYSSGATVDGMPVSASEYKRRVGSGALTGEGRDSAGRKVDIPFEPILPGVILAGWVKYVEEAGPVLGWNFFDLGTGQGPGTPPQNTFPTFNKAIVRTVFDKNSQFPLRCV